MKGKLAVLTIILVVIIVMIITWFVLQDVIREYDIDTTLNILYDTKEYTLNKII
ncbi:hypothetical protein AB4Y30_13140 [Ornithinibacillus sp. 4-3]|uniref:Uncharacterized protein n=1 Tax=Ornithinibacillus sp. 4-3 TaxID=3231488 RepID=A0AB39HLD1_9BACI